MNDRLKTLRSELGLNQEEFGDKINLSRSHVASLENGIRNLTDRTLSDLSRVYRVNREWLLLGKGEMFTTPDSVSLDDYAKNNKLSNLEIDIIKAYMDIDKDVRKQMISSFKQIFSKHSDLTSKESEDKYDIDLEVEAYRKELEAEKKGITLSQSESGEDIG